MTFGGVGVEQAVGCLAVDDESEFPAEVGGVLQAEVKALPTDRGEYVGGVAREQDTAAAVCQKRTPPSPCGSPAPPSMPSSSLSVGR